MYMKSNIILRLRNSKKNILDHVTQLHDLLTQGHANDNVTFPISCLVFVLLG